MPENGKLTEVTLACTCGNQIIISLCHVCGFLITDKNVCPNAVNHPAPPPLGVCVSDTSGVAGKIGN